MTSRTGLVLVFIAHWQRRHETASRRLLRDNIIPALHRVSQSAAYVRKFNAGV